MKFDVSAANLYLFCPMAWEERYVHNLELDVQKLGYTPGYTFGGRFHKLLQEHYSGKPAGEPEGAEGEIEADAQVMLANYKAWYPEEDFEVVEWEKYFEVGIGEEKECGCTSRDELEIWVPPAVDCPICKGTGRVGKHTYCGKWDAIVRMKDTGRLKVLDTKTEKRNSKANTDQRWAVLDQGSLYMYAGERVWGEQFDGIILNICTKSSPKGQIPPEFHRLRLERSREQIEKAVSDAVRVAEHMELSLQIGCHGHREECVSKMTGWRCDFYDLHVLGRSEETLSKYKQGEDYLHGYTN